MEIDDTNTITSLTLEELENIFTLVCARLLGDRFKDEKYDMIVEVVEEILRTIEDEKKKKDIE